MGFFRSVLDSLKVDRTPYHPSLLEFPAVDPVKLRRELKLEERGKTRGAAGQPPSEHAGLDEVEQDVVARFQGFHQQSRDSLTNNRQVYAGRLARLDNRTLLEAVDREFESAISDFKADVRTDASNLFLLRRNVLEGEHEYGEFRRTNRLHRMAKYPAHWFQNVSIVLLFALGDTIANAVFFSGTHPRGWAGAVFESVFIALVNCITGFAAGFFLLRGCNHPRLPLRALAFVGLLVFFAFIVGFNVFAAHYRDAFAVLTPEQIAAGRDAASAEALRRLSANLWVLSGFQSYLMVAVGLIVAGVALVEGYRLDDATPGFGAVARHREKQLASYAASKQLLLEGLRERKDEALAAIDTLVEEIRRREEEYSTVLEAQRGLVQRYNAFIVHLESAANQLLESYRGANRAARRTPPPPGFARPWTPGWSSEAAPAEPDAALRAGTADRLMQRLGDARRAFLHAYDEAVVEYLRIDQIVSKEALDHARAEVG
jgi:hypothetical protein